MKDTKEGLPKKNHRWYYACLVIAGLLFSLWAPLQVSAATAEEKSHVALVIGSQETDTSYAGGYTPKDSGKDAGQSSKMQKVQTEHITTSRMLQHVFVIVFGGVLCVGMGVGVLVYHIHQDRADAAYAAGIQAHCQKTSVYEDADKKHEKENYGERTVFIQQKQT